MGYAVNINKNIYKLAFMNYLCKKVIFLNLNFSPIAPLKTRTGETYETRFVNLSKLNVKLHMPGGH